MTHFNSPTTIDLPTLDGVIAKHLQAHARRIGGFAERYARNTGESSGPTSIVLMDLEQDLFAGCSEAIFAYRMFAHGYDAALALAAVTSRSPFCPDEPAVAAVLRQSRAQIAATVADERAKWGLPA